MKTGMGEFLSVLRRSRGMTQQEAADLLGVSNKTVSGWETGASCPDISMLPALAELYGVTCDELLRGERIPAPESTAAAGEKREKSLARLLEAYRSQASTACWVCAVLFLAAVLAVLLIGCAALQSLIGFFVGLFLAAGGVFWILIRFGRLRSRLTQDDFESQALEKFRNSLSLRQDIALLGGAATFGFLLPHAFVSPYLGLSLPYALGHGLLGGALSALAALLVLWAVRALRRSCLADRPRFFRMLRRGAVCFGLPLLAGGAVLAVIFVLLPATIPTPEPPELQSWDSYAGLAAALEESDLFGTYEHTLLETDQAPSTLSEQTLNAALSPELNIGSLDASTEGAVWFFPSLPAEYEDRYVVTRTAEGAEVRVPTLTLTLENGEVLSLAVLNPEYQGGLFFLYLTSHYDPETLQEGGDGWVYTLEAQFQPPLYRQAEARRAADRADLLAWLAAGGWAVLTGVCVTVFFLLRRKDRASKVREEDPAGAGDRPPRE